MILTWTDNANNEVGFRINQATNPTFTAGFVSKDVGTNSQRWESNQVARFTTYYVRIAVFNMGGQSAWSATFSVTTP